MKKSWLKIAVLSTAIAAGTIPLHTSAAEITSVKLESGYGYAVLSEKGLKNLRESLRELGLFLQGSGFLCPPIIEKPQQPSPETPQRPETPSPETPELPDTPEQPLPENPEQPETEGPENPSPNEPEIPTPEEPEEPKPETPDTPSPEAVSYAEQVAALVNEARVKAGLNTLEIDPKVMAAADVRAGEIQQSFSHTRPNGSSFATTLKEQGVSYSGSGENIAWGQQTPRQVMDSWMSSSGHRANILEPKFKYIGVGYEKDSRGRTHWVQLFTY